jgi:hypothetical protein
VVAAKPWRMGSMHKRRISAKEKGNLTEKISAPFFLIWWRMQKYFLIRMAFSMGFLRD